MSGLINQSPTFTLGETTIANTMVKTLITEAQTLDFDQQGKLNVRDVELKLIPYYAWCHRGSGKMRVWQAQDLSATTPSQPATLASESKITSSHNAASLNAINDRLIPKDESDRSIPYFHWWPNKQSTEWLAYEFPQPSKVQSCTVYWFDDGPWGGCRTPKSWRILYKDASGQWIPVNGADGYPSLKGEPSTVNFEPVETTALKMEITLPDDNSAGLFEWSVR